MTPQYTERSVPGYSCKVTEIVGPPGCGKLTDLRNKLAKSGEEFFYLNCNITITVEIEYILKHHVESWRTIIIDELYDMSKRAVGLVKDMLSDKSTPHDLHVYVVGARPTM